LFIANIIFLFLEENIEPNEPEPEPEPESEPESKPEPNELNILDVSDEYKSNKTESKSVLLLLLLLLLFKSISKT